MHNDARMAWWLSFVDTTKSEPLERQVPGGGGFLGVAVVGPATTFLEAVTLAWELRLNPGGNVQGSPLPLARVDPALLNTYHEGTAAVDLMGNRLAAYGEAVMAGEI